MKKITLLCLLFLTSILTINYSYSQTNDCFTSNPFCSSNQYDFPNATSGSAPSGPNYGCLATRPKPIWYYMEIDTPGTIQISITQTSGQNATGAQYDVDFALWGPFSSLEAGCQSIMSGGLAPLQCSYSTSYSETIGIGMPGGYSPGYSTPPSAQIGEVYIVLLTNYNGSPGYISFNQTGGTGSADCSIVEPCSIVDFLANVSVCTQETGTYSVSGSIDVVNAPETGQLIVQSCAGNQQVVASAPFTSGSYSYTLAGLNADGQACDIEAYFTGNADCSAVITYTAPECDVCSIADISVNTTCQIDGTYTVSGEVSFSLPPTTGTLTVTTSTGGSQTFNAPFTSPLTYSIAGLTANGTATTITASFSDDAACTLTENFNAPTAITPTFDPISLCVGADAPVLPPSSTNGITGTWTPNVVQTENIGMDNYDFIPAAGQCAVIGILTIPVEGLPNVNINEAGALYECLVEPLVNLSGNSTTPGVDYSWSGNGIVSGGSTPNVTVNATGDYVLTVTNATSGCTNSDTVTVIGDGNEPQVSIDAPGVISCDNTLIDLNATSSTPGTTFTWVPNPGIVEGETTLSPTVNAAGVYQINVLNPVNGCTNSAAVTVTGNTIAPPMTTSTGPYEISCLTPTVTVYAVSSVSTATYAWTGPSIDSGASSSTITVSGAGTYSVLITNPENNCTSTALFTVTGDTISPTVSVLNNPVLDCNNVTVVLNAQSSSNVGIEWNGLGVVSGGTTLNPVVNVQGQYTITVTDLDNNCTASATGQVTQVNPVIPAIFPDTMLCGTVFEVPLNLIQANGEPTWTEVSGNGSFDDINVLDPVFTGVQGITSYELLFTDECGYTMSSNVFLIPPTVVSVPDVSCNLNEVNIFTNSYTGGTWSVVENPNTPYIEDTTLAFVSSAQIFGQVDTTVVVVQEPGYYSLFFDNEGICPDTTVTLYFPPYIWTEVKDTTLCLGVNYELVASEGNFPVTYSWNTGATGPSIPITQPGDYIVTITSQCNTYSDTATIVYEMCDIDAPNVISLSSNAGNNLWYVQSKGITEFECIIVNRWGNLIYEYNDVNAGWDGRDKGGNIVSEGVYFYTIKATIGDQNEITKQGFITVVH